MPQRPLFSNGVLSEVLESSKNALKKEFENMKSDYVLNASETDLSNYLVSRYNVEPLSLRESDISMEEPHEVDVDVSRSPRRIFFDQSGPYYVRGTAITIIIPFDGDADLFKYRSSTFTYDPPAGEIKNQELHLVYEEVEHNAEELKQRYADDLAEIKRWLEWIKNEVDAYNESLKPFVKEIIEARKKKILDAKGVVGALGIPIKRRGDAPQTYAVPTVRRKPQISRPSAKENGFAPEPVLPAEEYEHILGIIKNMVLVIERSPKAFVNMQEEDLRQHFLVQLNGHYEGQATGETFNYEGKTDILIRYENKNVFIAECKYWHGEKELEKAIDQLLRYTSWRDTKTAILLFNRQKDFSAVLGKIPEVVKKHACYKAELGKTDDTTFRYLFHQPDDNNREFTLTVMAFNMPQE